MIFEPHFLQKVPLDGLIDITADCHFCKSRIAKDAATFDVKISALKREFRAVIDVILHAARTTNQNRPPAEKFMVFFRQQNTHLDILEKIAVSISLSVSILSPRFTHRIN